MSNENNGSALSSLAGSALGGVAGAGVQLLGNAVLGRMEQNDYRKNQRQNYEYSQMAQRNAAVNNMQGMQRAGLSPATMQGGSFSPAAQSQAPLQNKSSGMPNINAIGDFLSLQQARTAKAVADKTEAETTGVKLQNDVTRDSMAMTNHALSESLSKAIADAQTDAERDSLQSLSDSLVEFRFASPESIRDSLRLSRDISQYSTDSLGEKMRYSTLGEQLSAEIWRDNAHMPREQRKKLVEEINYTVALANKVGTDAAVNVEKVKELDAQIHHLNQMVKESKAKVPTYDAQRKLFLSSSAKNIQDVSESKERTKTYATQIDVNKANARNARASADKTDSTNDKKLIETGNDLWAVYNKIWHVMPTLNMSAVAH